MFICFDTEDDSKELMEAGKSGFDKQVTQIAGIATNAKFYNTGNVREFLKWLQERPEKYIYALNLQYDLGNLFGDELDALDLTLVGGRLIKAAWGGKVFVDVFNIWPMSVAKIGKVFGIEKLETSSMTTDKAYVFRDCEIIYAAMEFAWKLAADFDIKECPPTLGGLCIKAWKHMGGVNCHDTSPLCREAYYGGRVELFKEFNESNHVCYTDINSLYPSQMLKDFPAELIPWTEERLPKYGVARVTIKIPKTAFGPLPYRSDDGRILYPYGQITGVWTIAEINAAISRGARILERHDCLGTDEAIRPYGSFITEVYERRLAAKTEPEKLFYKLLMNNLYGRLGTGGTIGRTVWRTADNENDGISYGEKVLVNYQMPLAQETNWIHAAYVTAYGRIRLLEFMEKIGADNMIYCDTDSTIFDCATKTIPFECSNKLGEMKLEDWLPRVQTYAPKEYRAGDKYKAKGVPVRLAETFLTTGRAEFDLPFKLRESITFYDRGNARKLSVWRKVVKERKGGYNKKRKRGNRYFPLQIKANSLKF